MKAGAADGSRAPAPVPIAFEDCSGWYHPPRPDRARGRGVVLCPAFGVEGLRTYRSMRVLANLLAEAGLPVLRFDYPGTGDSLGGEAPGRLEEWVAATGAAVATLRRASGAAEITLCGLRLGAAIAAEAARRRPGHIARLVLLAPVVSGPDYLRELTLRERLKASAHTRPEWVEVLGFALHASDQDRLQALDLADALRESAVPAALVLETATDRLPRPEPSATRITRRPFQGYAEFARDAHLAAIPEADFAAVVDFLREDAPESETAPPAEPGAGGSPVLTDSRISEAPIRFGPSAALFGVLCRPRVPSTDMPRTRLGVVILNTGSSHHIGDARYAVLLARSLARPGGFTSFRIDLGGIGDSDGQEKSQLLGGGPDAYRRALIRLYRRSYIGDVKAALDSLEACGCDRFVLVGVCSGARIAFDTALADARVLGLALGNLPSFGHRVGAAPPTASTKPTEELAVPLAHRVARALFGRRTRYHLTAALRSLRLGLGRMVGGRIAPLSALLGVSPCAQAVRAVRMLAARGVRVLLLYSRDDPTLSELEACFGQNARDLAKISGIGHLVLDGVEHAFEVAHMRDQLIAEVERLVEEIADGMSRGALPSGGSMQPEAAEAVQEHASR